MVSGCKLSGVKSFGLPENLQIKRLNLKEFDFFGGSIGSRDPTPFVVAPPLPVSHEGSNPLTWRVNQS